MYDDFPEPPPAPPACPNCNEELTDDPATPPGHYWGHAHVGAYCIGADGCGWYDEDGQGPYELHDQIQAVIEAQTWEVTIVLHVDGATPEAALAEWVANNGADRLPIAKAVRS